MRLETKFEAVALACKENEFERDGQKTKYYQISLDQDGECGTLSCSEDVFKFPINKYKPYIFTCQWDSSNGKMRVVALKEKKLGL